MATEYRILKNLYRDSVSLMQFSETLRALPGILQVSAVMATGNNLSLLVDSGLLPGIIPPSPNDLLIVVEGKEKTLLLKALDHAEKNLKQPNLASHAGGLPTMQPASIQMGLESMPAANLVLISTPGEYAAAEAFKALHLGLHVMLFSDNVRLEDEISLKQYSFEHNLLVMGPDCGTAIICGIPLGFANLVRRGDIGIVAASGTGLQQVASLIDRWGCGISQAIGTGSRDLKTEIGGITMLQGISLLAADPATKIILLVSKPPSPSVAQQVLDMAAKSNKPVIVDFIGAKDEKIGKPGIHVAHTLEEAASMAVSLSKGMQANPLPETLSSDQLIKARQAAAQLKPEQKYLRGLFSGGTFCYETLLLLNQRIGAVYSNTALKEDKKLADVWLSQKHTVIDLGDDLFTQGRPHPMIDFRLRNERIIQEAQDPEVAVILLDVVLGYGSNGDPAGELLPAIAEANRVAAKTGRKVIFVASVCGTDSDPQNLTRQEQSLLQVGVLLTDSNAQAARLAGEIVMQNSK
jgi:FdrA protein